MTFDEWPIVRLGDLGRIVTGRTPPGTRPEYFGGEIPFVTPTDMSDCREVERPGRYLSSEGAALLKSVLVPCGVAVSCIGWQMGKSLLITRTSATNQQINTIVPDGETVDLQFLYYALSAKREEIFRLGVGGSRTPILNKSGFANLKLRLPPLVEQRRVARTLGALDDKIELNRRNSRTLESIARAIFKSWFVDFDSLQAKAGGVLPELDGDLDVLFPADAEARATIVGAISEQWEIKPLDGVAHFLNGLALQKYPPTGESDLPAIKGAELTRGVTASSSFAGGDVPEEYVVRAGDVLFSWSGSLNCVIWTDVDGALNQHVFKVTSDTHPRWFVYFWVREHLPEFRLIAADKATTMGHIKRGHLSNAEVVVPPHEVLARADRVIGPLVDRWLAAESESRRLARLRDALLPRLMSGSLEIPQVSALEERSRHAAD